MATLYRIALPSLLLIASSCAAVGPGQAGVLWRATNGTQPTIYREGLHPIAGLDRMYVYDLRSQSRDEQLSVMTINGLGVKLNATVIFHVMPTEVVAIHEEIG